MRPEVNKIRLTVLIALLFSALCAGVFRTPPILFMAALLTSAPFVSMLISRINNRSLQISRSLPETGMVGDLVTGEITVKNRASWPVFLIHGRSGFAEGHSFISDSLGKAKARESRDKNLRPAVAVSGNDHQVVPLLRGHSEGRWHQQWLLCRRGVHQMLPAQAGALDPLGLSSHLPVRSEAQQITVLPRPVRLEQLGFLGGAGMEEQQPRHSTIVSDAMDFHGVRPWMPGEAIRRAHWKYTARTGQLYVIEWEEAPATDLAILLDVHAAAIVGDEDENTLETAITAAASIAAYLLEHGCRLQLFFFASEEADAPLAHASAAHAPLAKPKRRQAAHREVRLRMLSAHSVEHLDSILRALAEVVPVADERASASMLAEAASPQVARGMGTLFIASSRAPLDKVHTRAAPSSNRHVHALIVDADSFEMKAASKEKSLGDRPGTSTATNPAKGKPPTPVQHPTLLRRRRAAHKDGIPVLRRGEPIGAVLEGHR